MDSRKSGLGNQLKTSPNFNVIAGLVPAIHQSQTSAFAALDPRDKPGDDIALEKYSQ